VSRPDAGDEAKASPGVVVTGAAANASPVVVVTGAAGHLGTAIAHGLAERHARLVLVDLSADALAVQAERLSDRTAVATVAADATAPDTPILAFDAAVERFGRVDALVNNAGVEGPIARLEDLAVDDVRRTFEVNVFALLAFSAEAVRRFRPQGRGRIVNLASGAGLAGTGFMAAYSASKHAVVGLTRSLAREVAGAGIAVNAVCPGCVDSPMMDRIEARLGELAGTGPASFVPSIPAGRYCDRAEVAELVAWLTLEAPETINGSTQVIDGALRA
jgi:NAD(P)-dependent dehydrogenase (short-subunit alcohol dehydrogenase family)